MVLDNQCYLHIKMRLSRIDFVSITARFVYTYPENAELIGILTFPDLILNYVNGPPREYGDHVQGFSNICIILI